ncbi:MAG: 5-(carboxyamino)imidazole ribonucleotide synthase [Candidatus Nanopelagicales bacterium]|nr:5-(carboxyamino)imidazole ribonucleotide synthase [Candidatus Nanopelagicales bacterium]MDP4715150.1 5-(carboxyamino)imidazole ribonucleotide synthase [Candidatus Nanopelagicales bacterium]MDP4907067.1 5-(carboxyamino)imidazole ribonucleotide synthase [Candidatus Nanopelagicales bacterium]MDP4908024.1 5-(carboxyamino)imidazole ribonucleotide synthase [Candidatus Nanopelagicales bacterium]MDP4974255.1 5-(carboxyamino)imidazole ribonucleotide synthase [Candidatus Nanopelagicales bacterium]
MSRITPAPRVAMIGGGQLSRMTAAPAAALGVGLRILATDPEDSAAQVCGDVVIGSHDDLDALRRVTDGVSVVTFDHEHVPPDHLRALEASGVIVRPGSAALVHAQDKITMRAAIDAAGLPAPKWCRVDTADDIDHAGETLGWPLILKVSRGGYDGRGVWVVDSADAARDLVAQTPLAAGAAWLAEERVNFRRELAAQVARSPHGQAVAYPVVRTVQVDGMCSEVVAPCPDLDDERALQAQAIALEVARALDVTGMLAVEMFDTDDGMLINELAMRPHNCGHWTIDGAVTSQFENHLRAVLDLPLGDPRAVAPWSVMVNIVGPVDSEDLPPLHEAFAHILARDPGIKVHLYGKAIRPHRKLGHVTVVGDDLEDLLDRAHHAADYLMGVIND